MSRRRRMWLVAIVGLWLVLAATRPAHPAGPWKAQIVDAATGQPVQGVIVVALYFKNTPGAIHPTEEFYAADEVVSDATGWVTIPARDTRTLNPSVRIAGPQFIFFKPGYGQWRSRGAKEAEQRGWDAYEKFRTEADERFAGAGDVMELDRLRTRQERWEWLGRIGQGSSVPEERIPRFTEAFKREERALGPMR